MPFFDQYPYTNFHNVNLDWILERVKEWGTLVEQNNTAFHNLKEANEDFKRYVTNYLENLNVQEEINNKLDSMLESGVLTEYMQPYISETVTTWLDENITEPTGVVIDASLTVEGACADARAVGNKIEFLREAVRTGSITELARTLILNCFNNVVWNNRAGQDYYEALKHEIFGSELIITYSQPQIFDYGTSLATIRNDLTVSYVNSQGAIIEVNDYTIEGELNSERSELTIRYSGRDGKLYIACAPTNRWMNDVLTISGNELNNGYVQEAFPYHSSDGNNRLAYTGIKFDFDNRYRYTITYNSNRTLNIGCRGYLKTAITPFANKKGVGAGTDSGWQNNNYIYNANGEVGKNIGFCFIALRKTDNSAVSPSEVTNIKITRVLR